MKLTRGNIAPGQQIIMWMRGNACPGVVQCPGLMWTGPYKLSTENCIKGFALKKNNYTKNRKAETRHFRTWRQKPVSWLLCQSLTKLDKGQEIFNFGLFFSDNWMTSHSYYSDEVTKYFFRLEKIIKFFLEIYHWSLNIDRTNIVQTNFEALLNWKIMFEFCKNVGNPIGAEKWTLLQRYH